MIPQSNGYDIEFCWNSQEYELVVGKMVRVFGSNLIQLKTLLIKWHNNILEKLSLVKVEKLVSNK